VSPRGGTRVRATAKPVVVLAGEDANDRRCLRIVLEALCPQMAGRLVEINDTVRLRDASAKNLAARAGMLRQKAKARAAREDAELACVFVHEDFDRVDGDEYLTTHGRVQAALAAELGSAHYVLSVWEMESWLFLFPDALLSRASAWRIPAQFRNKDTGLISDPKAVLKRQVSSPARKYRESDAPEVFTEAVLRDILNKPRGTSRSWTQLRDDAADCCRSHLAPRR
jgi:hypothetical protein